MTKERYIWKDIVSRCHNENDTSYELNGAKGIEVCERWRNSSDNFLMDMGKKPSLDLVLGRIDKTKNFNKSNCRWMTMKEAQLNKANMVLTWEVVNKARDLYKTTDMTVKDIAAKLNKSVSSISIAIRGKTWKDPNYNYEKRVVGGKSCSVKGCTREYHSKGFCILHKSRWLSHGDPLWEPEKEIPHNHEHRVKRKIKEYGIWDAMIQRCTNPNNAGYFYYGGRGITVCEEWLEDFYNFYADMGKRPFPEAQIDRKDNSKGYCKENCRWVTPTVNNRNTRANVLNENIVKEIRLLREKGYSYKKISIELKISYENVRSVLSRGAWV